MPIVQISMLEGRTDEQKENVIAEITRVLGETINAPADSVRVIINDMPKQNYGIAGVTAKNLNR